MFVAIKDIIKEIVYKIIPLPYQVSFSQSGEDAIIDFLFNGLSINKPTYLELGVYTATTSNTYKYYLKGARGVLVEADENLISNIIKKRPFDTVINCGIASKNVESADFYIFSQKGIGTFSKEEALKRQKSGQYTLEKIAKVSLLTINKLIETNFATYPDFLSIDIEGLDFEVLQTLDYTKYPIPVICAETCTYSENHIKPKDKRIEEFLLTKGYFIYADTYINTIFVNEKWFLNKVK